MPPYDLWLLTNPHRVRGVALSGGVVFIRSCLLISSRASVQCLRRGRLALRHHHMIERLRPSDLDASLLLP